MPTFRYYLFATLVLSSVFVFAQKDEVIANNTSSKIDSCNVYQIILSGKEAKVKSYFREVEEFDSVCTEQIFKAFTKLNAKSKVTHTIWILEEVKNRSTDIREKIYSTLLKVNYPKPAYLLKPMINGYFTNYREPEDSLAKQVNALHWSMIK